MSYLALAVVFLIPALAVAAFATWRCRLSARWWAATAATIVVLLVLTIVFDSLMIAADLFRFDEEQLTGLRVGLAPVEDLMWPVAAGLLLPSMAALLDRACGGDSDGVSS